LFKGGAAILADSQNGDIIVLSHILSLTKHSSVVMRIQFLKIIFAVGNFRNLNSVC
jgi:hypothetical protein